MTLIEAKHILTACGYNVTLVESKDAYDYLTESMLIDKIKSKASSIIKGLKHNDDEAKADAVDLIKNINKSTNISSTIKKGLLITLVGLIGGMSMAHGESLGEFFANQYNEGAYELYIDGIDINKRGNPKQEDIETDAQHVAVALKGAKIQGINIESAYLDGAEEDDRQEAVVYNFDDGYSVYIDINDEINILEHGQVVRHYMPNNPEMDAMLEYAFEIAK